MSAALVTGGTSGIGRAFAEALAARGDDLVLVARDAERLRTVANELTSRHGVFVEVFPADLSVREDVLKVAARIESTDHPIDLLVNNAGFGLHGSLLDEDFSIQEKAMDVMCLAVLILSGAAGRAMKARGHGAILNVASSSGVITTGNYSAIKAWCTTYTEGLAVELKGTGVKVMALLPGWVRTEFHERAGITAHNLPNFVWIPVERLVSEALADLDRGKVLSVPTKRWALAVGIGRTLPRPFIRWLSGRLSKSRR